MLLTADTQPHLFDDFILIQWFISLAEALIDVMTVWQIFKKIKKY